MPDACDWAISRIFISCIRAFDFPQGVLAWVWMCGSIHTYSQTTDHSTHNEQAPEGKSLDENKAKQVRDVGTKSFHFAFRFALYTHSMSASRQ